MKMLFRYFAVACAAFLMPSEGLGGERLTVFAAASLKGALDEAVVEFPHPVTLSYGGSGLIARQIALGAPADLAILAHEDWLDWLASKGTPKILERKKFLSNSLVVIGPAGSDALTRADAREILDRLAGGRLAVGMIESVPAGIYARQWMERAGLWEVLAPHLAQTDNVRAALALVARGEAPLGITYASDALAERGVDVLYPVPPDLHDEIVYPIAVLDTKNAAEASELAEYLFSEPAAAIFIEHGFQVVEDAR